MSAGLRGTDRPLAEVHDLALTDLDGVAYKGPHPIDHAAEAIAAAARAGMPAVFVTNNASREPGSIAAQLVSLGFDTSVDDILTSAQAAGAVLAERLSPGSKVLVVGGAGLVTAVEEVGLSVVHSADDAPAAVVQGFAPEVGWPMLAEAAYAIRAGAWYVASNRDLTLPTERGFAPGNGSLVAAVVAATGVEPRSCGKPEPTMYELAATRRGAVAPMVIGDRLDTDLAGARRAGWPGLLVLTGVNGGRDAVLAAPGERPSYIGADLRCLLEEHPLPELLDGRWTCGTAWARVTRGRLEVSDTRSVDAIRAACAAVWSAVDSGTVVDTDTVPNFVVA